MSRQRIESHDPTPLRYGYCDWCGARCPIGPSGKRNSYCCPEHRQLYRNLLTAQGKAVIQLLKVWRKHRGGKGTAGEGVLTKVCARLDQMLAEDRERISRLSCVAGSATIGSESATERGKEQA